MRKFIIPYLDNGCYSEYELDQNVVIPIHEFINNARYDIQNKINCQDNEVIVCMPNYIIDFFKYLNSKTTNQPHNVNGIDYYQGMKVQLSYANEIVVFYNAYVPERIIKYTMTL